MQKRPKHCGQNWKCSKIVAAMRRTNNCHVVDSVMSCIVDQLGWCWWFFSPEASAMSLCFWSPPPSLPFPSIGVGPYYYLLLLLHLPSSFCPFHRSAIEIYQDQGLKWVVVLDPLGRAFNSLLAASLLSIAWWEIKVGPFSAFEL